MKSFRRSEFIRSAILAAGTGALFSASLFSSWLGVLGWVCFVPLITAISGKTSRHSLILGMISGTVMNLVSLYWLVGTLNRFGGFSIPTSAVVVMIFCVYSSLQFGIFTLYVSRFKLLQKKTFSYALFISFAWVVTEFFFPVLFPYGIAVSQGYYQQIIQIVDTFGIHFLGFVMFFTNVSIFYTVSCVWGKKRPPLATIVVCVALIATVLAYGPLRIEQIEEFLSTKSRIRVAMVQANFDYAEKSTENEQVITETHRKMSEELTGADVVIWPETSVQYWFSAKEPVYAIDQRKIVPQGHGSYFLIGGLSYVESPELFADGWDEEDFKKYNTVFLVDPQSNILGTYSKTRLFFLGEYFPLVNQELRFLKRIFPMIGDLSPGEELATLEIPEKNIKIGPLICYEDIMPKISREYVAMGANLLVNLTNDAWFGKSHAPFQHLLLSIPRAVETRRYLVRSTNSGVSAVISPTGKIESNTDIFTTENLSAEVVLIDSLNTLYSKVGDLFAWIALVATALFAVKTYLSGKYAD